MTPKQKQQRQYSLEMIRFLGVKGDFTKMSYAHMRRIIESKKLKILNVLGIDASDGLDRTDLQDNS